MFELLRQAGIKAEKAMLAATNNVNTHKGAVFSLGLFVCACAYCQKHGGNEFEVIQMMTKGLVKHDLGEKSERLLAKDNFCNMAKAALEQKQRQATLW